MRTIRIYQAGHFEPGEVLCLSPEAAHHLATVLRMQPGAPLVLFCGDNREFDAHIHSVKKKEVMVQIDSEKEANRESPLTIHLAQALSKGDRMDWVMQKSVELGVYDITPVVGARSVVRMDKERMEKKIKLWQSIVISACEQCGRNTIPKVHSPVTLEQYVKNCTAAWKLILKPETKHSLKDYKIEQSISVLIGPEGGFSLDEIQLALKQGFQPLSLGPRILRTETAAICMLSILQAMNGDL